LITERPVDPGWYWAKFKHEGAKPEIVKVEGPLSWSPMQTTKRAGRGGAYFLGEFDLIQKIDDLT